MSTNPTTTDTRPNTPVPTPVGGPSPRGSRSPSREPSLDARESTHLFTVNPLNQRFVDSYDRGARTGESIGNMLTSSAGTAATVSRTFEQFLQEKKQNGFDAVDRVTDYVLKSKATNVTFLSKIFYLVATIVEELFCGSEAEKQKIRQAGNVGGESETTENEFYRQCLLVQKVYGKLINKPQIKTLKELAKEFEKLHAFAEKMTDRLEEEERWTELERAHKLINEVLSKHVGADVAKEILRYFAQSKFQSQDQFMGNDLASFFLNFDGHVNDITSRGAYGSAKEISNVFLGIVTEIGTKNAENRAAHFQALNSLTDAMEGKKVSAEEIKDYKTNFSKKLKAILEVEKPDPIFLIDENEQRTLITQHQTYCKTKAQLEKEQAEFDKLFSQHNNKMVEHSKIQSAEIAVSYDTLVELFGEDPSQRPEGFNVPILTDVDVCKNEIATIDLAILVSSSKIQDLFQPTLIEKNEALAKIQGNATFLSNQKEFQEKDLKEKRAVRDSAKGNSPGSINVKSTPDQRKNFDAYSAAQKAVEEAKDALALTETELNELNVNLAKLKKEIAAIPAQQEKEIEAAVKPFKQQKKLKEHELAQYKKRTVMVAKQYIASAYDANVQRASEALFEDRENGYKLFKHISEESEQHEGLVEQTRLEDVSFTEEGHGENSYKLFEDISKELKKHQDLVDQARQKLDEKGEDLTNILEQLDKAEKDLMGSGYSPETEVADLAIFEVTSAKIEATILKERERVVELAYTVIGEMVKPKGPEEKAKANLQNYQQAKNEPEHRPSRDASGYNNNRYSETYMRPSNADTDFFGEKIDDNGVFGMGANHLLSGEETSRGRGRAVSLGDLPRRSRSNSEVKASEQGDTSRGRGRAVSLGDSPRRLRSNSEVKASEQGDTSRGRGRAVSLGDLPRRSRSNDGTQPFERPPIVSTSRTNNVLPSVTLDLTGLNDSSDEDL